MSAGNLLGQWETYLTLRGAQAQNHHIFTPAEGKDWCKDWCMVWGPEQWVKELPFANAAHKYDFRPGQPEPSGSQFNSNGDGSHAVGNAVRPSGSRVRASGNEVRPTGSRKAFLVFPAPWCLCVKIGRAEINGSGRDAENGIRINGTTNSRIQNVRFENVRVKLDRWTTYEGGLYDNRPTKVLEPVKRTALPASIFAAPMRSCSKIAP